MNSLTLTRRIAARPSVVWGLLVTPEGLRRWIGPDAGPVLVAEADPRIGGGFRLRFRMEDGSEHEARGTYVAVEPPTRLVMSWLWLGEEDEGGTSEVEIRLRPVDDGTELAFTHRRLSSKASRDGHVEGWTGSLDKLAAAVAADDAPAMERGLRR